MSFLCSQDVAHAGQERPVPDRRQRLGPLSEMAGFQVSINGRYDQLVIPAAFRRPLTVGDDVRRRTTAHSVRRVDDVLDLVLLPAETASERPLESPRVPL